MRAAVARARSDPDCLASWLASVAPAELCRRLGCDLATALRAQLYAFPDPYCWWADLRAIGGALHLDPAALHALLGEAVRRRWAAPPHPRSRSDRDARPGHAATRPAGREAGDASP